MIGSAGIADTDWTVMMAMADREKVIIGLECCKVPGGDCGMCPYSSDEPNLECTGHLANDALALLKEPEPHLMTVEELEALPVGAVVWEEFLDVDWRITRTELDPVMKTKNGNLIGMNGYTTIMDGMGDPDVDGNAWRWWSSRPTEEQRKAVKWT